MKLVILQCSELISFWPVEVDPLPESFENTLHSSNYVATNSVISWASCWRIYTSVSDHYIGHYQAHRVMDKQRRNDTSSSNTSVNSFKLTVIDRELDPIIPHAVHQLSRADIFGTCQYKISSYSGRYIVLNLLVILSSHASHLGLLLNLVECISTLCLCPSTAISSSSSNPVIIRGNGSILPGGPIPRATNSS